MTWIRRRLKKRGLAEGLKGHWKKNKTTFSEKALEFQMNPEVMNPINNLSAEDKNHDSFHLVQKPRVELK